MLQNPDEGPQTTSRAIVANGSACLLTRFGWQPRNTGGHFPPLLQKAVQGILLALVALVTLSCLTGQDKVQAFTNKPFVAVTSKTAWEPGLLPKVRQVILFEDGSGQIAFFRGSTISRLEFFSAPKALFEKAFSDAFFALDDAYYNPEEIEPGLVAEGAPESTDFVFASKGLIKNIYCHDQAMPGTLKNYKFALEQAAFAAGRPVEEPGRYLMAEAVEFGQGIVREDACDPRQWDSELQKGLPALFEALAQPGLMVGIDGKMLADIKRAPCMDELLEKEVFVRTFWGLGLLNLYFFNP